MLRAMYSSNTIVISIPKCRISKHSKLRICLVKEKILQSFSAVVGVIVVVLVVVLVVLVSVVVIVLVLVVVVVVVVEVVVVVVVV